VLANDGVGATADACEPLVGFPAGAIAVVDRGTCEFGFKALMAQNAGATAVIVADNAPGAPTQMGAGAVGSQVTIPAVRVSQVDGNTLKAALPTSASIVRNTDFGCGSHTATGVPDRRNDLC
jgi:extracellular elastinolytic metalloproteinase